MGETLGSLEVGCNTLLDSLGLSLTNLDGTSDSLVEVSLHGLGLVLDELPVRSSGLGDVVHDASEGGDVALGTLRVGSDNIGEHTDLGSEHLLGTLERVRGGSGGSRSGSRERIRSGHLGLLHVSHLLVHSLGGRREVLGHLDAVAVVAGTGVRELGLQGGGKGGNLGRGGCLVLVHEEFELATGTFGLGEAGVRDADNALEVGRHTTVDAELVGLEGDDLASGDSDLANEAGLDFLGESSHTRKLGGEVLAELLHLGGSLGASGTEILHGLGEPRSEGSLLSERVVEASDGSTKLLRSIAA